MYLSGDMSVGEVAAPFWVMDANHVPPQGVLRGRGEDKGDVGTILGGGVPVRVSFLRYNYEEVILRSAG